MGLGISLPARTRQLCLPLCSTNLLKLISWWVLDMEKYPCLPSTGSRTKDRVRTRPEIVDFCVDLNKGNTCDALKFMKFGIESGGSKEVFPVLLSGKQFRMLDCSSSMPPAAAPVPWPVSAAVIDSFNHFMVQLWCVFDRRFGPLSLPSIFKGHSTSAFGWTDYFPLICPSESLGDNGWVGGSVSRPLGPRRAPGGPQPGQKLLTLVGCQPVRARVTSSGGGKTVRDFSTYQADMGRGGDLKGGGTIPQSPMFYR